MILLDKNIYVVLFEHVGGIENENETSMNYRMLSLSKEDSNNIYVNQ